MSGDLSAELPALLGLIYDATLDPGQWATALAAINAAVGGEVSALLHWDNRTTPVASNVTAVSGYPETAIKAYENYFGPIDVRRPAFAALPQGAVYVDDRHMAFAEVERSEIQHDFYRPLGIGHGMAAKLFDDAARTSLLSVHRPLAHGAFRARDVALLESLTPHLVRALQLQRQVATARHVARAAAVGLDHFHVAVLIVDAEATVIELNQAAADLLRQPGAPLRREARRLCAATPATTQGLHEAIQSATAAPGQHTAPPNGILRLPRAGAGGAIAVMVAPVRRGGPVEGDALARLATPLALVFAADPARPVMLASDTLRRQFGLSAAEASVAVGLVDGSTVEAIAARRSVSQETVRAQLKRALAKTETHSQAQFIATIARSLAMLRHQRGG
jgi:DNA-binding CsgD family transcriptional regulator